MSINKAVIIEKLRTLVESDFTTGSTEVSDILATALSANILNDVNVLNVDSVDNLPNLSYFSLPNALLCYVEDSGIFAISSSNKWLTLDGTLLRQDALYGDVFSWGQRANGRLGNNTADPSGACLSSPSQICGGFTDWCQVYSGREHSLAVRANGTAWSWGSNNNGRLGDGSALQKSSPVLVAGDFVNWCQVSGGEAHSLGVRTNGTAWSWGSNNLGQGGNDTTVSASSPVSVVGGFTDWCQVSAGDIHSLGVRTDGTAWGWGYGGRGQLGDGYCTTRSSPVSVVGGFTDWCQVSAGCRFSLGVRVNGTAWGWGCGNAGQLGTGSTLNRCSPVEVSGGLTDWCQISAGGKAGFAVRTSGEAYSWGCQQFGVLGIGLGVGNRSTPTLIVGGFTDWCQVSASSRCSNAAGIRTNGTAWGWGNNFFGLIGDNTTIDRSSPVSVVGGFTDWHQISPGFYHTIGLRFKC